MGLSISGQMTSLDWMPLHVNGRGFECLDPRRVWLCQSSAIGQWLWD